jgi:heptosyltransferase II
MESRRTSLPNVAERGTVLVLRFSSVGDIILTSAALEALASAWPDARIVFVTKREYADLARFHPLVSGVETLAPGESLQSLRKRLAALGPAAVLDLHGKFRGMALRSLVDGEHRGLWRPRPWYQSLGVRLRLTTYHCRMPVAQRYHEAVERLTGLRLERGCLSFHPGEAASGAARALLRDAGVDRERPLVGMAPGALWATKRWPIDRFAGLTRRLLASGTQVVLTGDASEAADTAAVARVAPGAVDLAGRLTLAELGGVIDSCGAFVANDSGPMHMARALGVPTVALFGCTDSAQFDFSGHALLDLRLPCGPCSLHGLSRCPRRHFRCMLEITVEMAQQAVEKLLAGNGKRHAVSA